MATPDRAEEFAQRAFRAQTAMEAAFRMRSGSYRRDGLLGRVGVTSFLWPLARALTSTLDLAGVDPALLQSGFDPDPLIAADLKTLEHYLQLRPPPAYVSDVPILFGLPPARDRYHDDNAWVALALVQLERMRPGAADLGRIEQLWKFAVSGWARSPTATPPGGVFWLEQGHGLGATNHDRNTVSCAPNAEVGLHLAELAPDPSVFASDIGPEQMFQWPIDHLDAGADGGGMFWDKIRGDGSVDRTFWSYNQGSMVGAGVLLARRGDAARLTWAEELARRALAHYAGAGLRQQPVEFNSILFRNLLLLHAETTDGALQALIRETFVEYADWLWDSRRGDDDRFDFGERGFTMLGQGGVVQICALLAWDPASYRLLA
ncbi:MAG: glycoside hydrolase family 76 protein [Solirubrobacteraceae bacterium]